MSNFSNTGGDDYKRLISNIMKKLLAKSVAVNYSLIGKKGKLKFAPLNMCSAVVGKILHEISTLLYSVILCVISFTFSIYRLPWTYLFRAIL